MNPLNFFGLGLISPQLLGSVALILLLLGGGLVQRQCTVMELDDKVDSLQAQAKKDGERLDKLAKDRDDAVRVAVDLRGANEQLASACEKQSQINTQFSEAMAEQERRAQAEKAAHEKEMADERAKSAWLSGLVKKQPALKPGECEAAVAVGDVRKLLRGQAVLEVR